MSIIFHRYVGLHGRVLIFICVSQLVHMDLVLTVSQEDRILLHVAFGVPLAFAVNPVVTFMECSTE